MFPVVWQMPRKVTVCQKTSQCFTTENCTQSMQFFCCDSVLKNCSHGRETRSDQPESHTCNYQVLLGLPVAVLVSIYLSTSLAFCGKEDANVSTPTNLILLRTRKAEKRKARTEKA